MKNIPAFAVLVSIVLLAFINPHIWGDEKENVFFEDDSSDKPYAFFISVSVDIFYGQAEEIVYKLSDDAYLSQLLWDWKPLIFVGADLEFAPYDPWTRDGFALGIGAKLALPLKTGSMEDRDWMAENKDHLTHYSHHDAYASGSFIADLRAGYSWAFLSRLVLKAVGEFSYMQFSWTGEDGYTQYPPGYLKPNYPSWDSGLPKNNIYGPGIIYRQIWLVLSPELSLAVRINRLFSFRLYEAWTPLLYGVCQDDHLLTRVQYTDYLWGGSSYKIGIEAIFSINSRIELSALLGYHRIKGPRGDTYMLDTTSASLNHSLSTDRGGAGFQTVETALSLRVKF